MNGNRSDLAVEICSEILEHNPHPDGIKCTTSLCGRMPLDEVEVKTKEGERLSGKPRGRYLTLNTGRLWLDDRECFREKLTAFSQLLSAFLRPEALKNGVLVACLGNRSIIADAVGPAAAEYLMVTRHLKKERPLIFEDLGLAQLCAVTPGVLGQTGIESADVIHGVIQRVQPSALIVIDALVARDLSRLVTTIQLCDTGIRPGSGIGNSRPALLPEELGIPVISLGVPTVVDAATLAADAIGHFASAEANADRIREEWGRNGMNFFVTPKETDQIIRVVGSFLGYGINLALNPEISYEDMLSLVG
ncbi:MAG: GPR endopeptidase [Clostridia bacterium]|nr:GPR endopeptidase [Clostridia bacterium]